MGGESDGRDVFEIFRVVQDLEGYPMGIDITIIDSQERFSYGK